MLARSNRMIVWTPIAVNEKSHVRGKKRLLPEYSAAVIGSSVVLRLFGGGLGGLLFTLTTVPFANPTMRARGSRRTEWTWLTRASSPTAVEPNALQGFCRLHLHPVDGCPQHGVWAERVPNETCKISRSVSRRWHQRRACPHRRRQVAGEVGPAGHHREPQRRQRQHRCCDGGAGGTRWLYPAGLGNAAARHQPEPL